MPDRFAREITELLRGSEEVRIETVADTGRVHRTIIWVVVDDRDRVLIRSYLGSTARWFREALARPAVALLSDDRRIEATAVVATDDDRIEAASRGYRAKYAASPSTPAMLDERVLSTTLELVPR